MRMPSSRLPMGALLACGCFTALAQQPVLTSINNAASYETAIGQGSMFVGFGRNLGPAALVSAPTLPLGTTLAGTSIRFTAVSGGASIDAFMIYTSAGQVSGILPSNAAPGAYNVSLTFNGQASAAFRATVVTRAYGMFTIPSSGTGPAVAHNAISATEVTVNRFTSPARPGQVMILYGTGLGPVTVPDNAPPGAQDLLAQAGVRVIVGGREIVPAYAGRSPGFPALDQINFALPSDIAVGCTVPLQVRSGGVTTSRPVSLSIAPTGTAVCVHPLLPAAAISKLDSGQPLTIGSLNLTAFEFTANVPIVGNLDVRSESFSGVVERLTLANAAAVDPIALGLNLQLGACLVFKQRTSGFSIDPISEAPVESLDAGAALRLDGPNVANRSVPRGADNQYDLDLLPFTLPLPGSPPVQPVIARGQYVVTAPGGTGVQAFTARTDVPDRPVWTNRADIAAIRRSTPLTLNWTGEAPMTQR